MSSRGLPRTLEVQVRNAGGTTVLGTPYSYSVPQPFFSRSGWVDHAVDLSAYTGQTIELAFVETVPESFTGPAQFGIDEISLRVEAAPRVNRSGYCSVAGNTTPAGAAIPPGTFLDLPADESSDSNYKGASPAYFYQGVGISCDVLPGYTKTGEMVGYWGHGDPGGYTYMARN
jgi:hypothetical protein